MFTIHVVLAPSELRTVTGCNALDLCRSLRLTDRVDVRVGRMHLPAYVDEAFARAHFPAHATEMWSTVLLSDFKPGELGFNAQEPACLVGATHLTSERIMELFLVGQRTEADPYRAVREDLVKKFNEQTPRRWLPNLPEHSDVFMTTNGGSGDE